MFVATQRGVRLSSAPKKEAFMYCILVSGMPASGKSTIAQKISQSLNLPVFSKDSAKEVLFDTVGFSCRAEKVQLGVAAMRVMYYTAEQMMRANKPFILENNFENESVQGIFQLLEKYRYVAITVRLLGDPSVIYQRFAERDLSPERHRGHVVNDCYPEPAGAVRENPTRKTYAQFLDDIEKRGFTRFVANGPLIEVDVTDFSKVDYDEVLRKIQLAVNSCN